MFVMKTTLHVLRLAVLSVFILAATGCAYLHIQRPLDMDYDRTELGAKQGRASSHAVLWLVAWGDSGSKAAADAGNVKVIRHADIEVYSVLFGLYTRTSTVVYGD
jgi:hypothetical protein